MNRFLSVARRCFDKDWCALIAMAAFLAFAVYGSAGLSAAVLAWRLTR